MGTEEILAMPHSDQVSTSGWDASWLQSAAVNAGKGNK